MSDLSDADLIRLWAQAGVEVLREHRQELNALNVFPVPDGDTGTNMYLTFRAAAEAEAARTGADDDAADALTAMARTAFARIGSSAETASTALNCTSLVISACRAGWLAWPAKACCTSFCHQASLVAATPGSATSSTTSSTSRQKA